MVKQVFQPAIPYNFLILYCNAKALAALMVLRKFLGIL
jgi:hypothetical protein